MLKKLALIVLILVLPIAVSAGMKTNISLSTSNIKLVGEFQDDYVGYSVETVGDINNDSVDDMLVGAPKAVRTGADQIGMVYLVVGNDSWSPSDSAKFTMGIGQVTGSSFVGEAAGDNFGNKVSSAGDVKCDGFMDFMIAAESNDSSALNAGKVYLFFGQAGAWGKNVAVSGSADVIFEGEAAGDHAGRSITRLGDFNGDGYADIVIGAPEAGAGGKVYIFLGRGSWNSSYSLSEADISFTASQTDSFFGDSVAGVGDVDNDGFDDMVISEYYYSSAATAAEFHRGKVWLVLGAPAGWSENMPITQNASASYVGETGINLGLGYDHSMLGRSIAAAGDINADGYDDLVLSAVGWRVKGKIYLILGKPSGWNLDQDIDVVSDASWVGKEDGDDIGDSLSGVGDLNGDGMSEILIGGTGVSGNRGAAYIIMGRNTDFTTGNVLEDPLVADGSYYGETAGQRAGFSISGGGDVDGDGFDDMLLSAVNAGGNNEGIIHIMFLFANTPPLWVNTLNVYASSNYSTALAPSINVNDQVYVEMIGQDGDPWVTNNAFAFVSSGTDGTGILFRLYETAKDTGVYRSYLDSSARSSSSVSKRIHVSGGDTAVVTSLVATSPNVGHVSANILFKNRRPSISGLSGEQDQGRVPLIYNISDPEEDDCTVTSLNTQCQYAQNLAGPWTAASMSGQASAIYTDSSGVTHDSTFQPLYWEPGRVSASYYVRIKPRDMYLYSAAYATTNAVAVDTTPPTMPVFTLPSLVSGSVLAFTGIITADTATVNYTRVGGVLVSLLYHAGLDIHVTLNLQEGTNTVYFYAADSRANTSNAATASVVLDTTPPATPNAAHASYSTSVNALVITGNCSVDTAYLTYTSTTIITVNIDLRPASQNWVATINMPSGIFNIYWKAIDTAGNRSGTSSTRIIYDNTIPTPALLASVSTLNAYSFDLHWTTYEPTLNMYIYVGEQLFAVTASAGTTNFVYNYLPVSPTNNTVYVILEDQAGNRSASSNVLNLYFADRIITGVTYNNIVVDIEIPLGALPVEDTLSFRFVSPSRLTAQDGAAPLGTVYLVGFDILAQNHGSIVTLNKSITVSVQFLPNVNTMNMIIRYDWREGLGYARDWQDRFAQTVSTANYLFKYKLGGLGRFAMCPEAFDLVTPSITAMTVYTNPLQAPLIVSGDFCSARPSINFTATDNIVLAYYEISIIAYASPNTVVVSTSNSSVNAPTADIWYRPPTALADGQYYYEVTVRDSIGNSLTRSTRYFTVRESVFVVQNVVNGPNPWNPNKYGASNGVVIGFELSKQANIKLIIFDLAGRMVEEQSQVGNIGYNRMVWDCRSGVRNGVYLGYFSAKDQSGREVKKKLKIAIMK